MTHSDNDFSDHPLSDNAEAIGLLREIASVAKALPRSLQANFAPGSPIYTTDFLVLAAARRTLSLSDAFLSMMQRRNFTVAASLLRLQLDTALRFSGLMHVESPDEYARGVLGGKRINKMRARSGEPLSDRFLVTNLSKSFPWVENVYTETSGFIHFSEKHIFQAIEHVHADGRMYASIFSEDVQRPSEVYLEILHTFLTVTELTSSLLISWCEAQSQKSPE